MLYFRSRRYCKRENEEGMQVKNMKTLKFRSELVTMILLGEKTSTWRLFDDKDLCIGDRVIFVSWETGKPFAKASLVDVYEKKLKDFKEEDWDGHEKFASSREMLKTYTSYYGKTVDINTIVKIIKFTILEIL